LHKGQAFGCRVINQTGYFLNIPLLTTPGRTRLGAVLILTSFIDKMRGKINRDCFFRSPQIWETTLMV